jgi:hypothetical protein
MIRAVAIRILRQLLLVIVGAEALPCTEITELSERDHGTGRVSVDVTTVHQSTRAEYGRGVGDLFRWRDPGKGGHALAEWGAPRRIRLFANRPIDEDFLTSLPTRRNVES